MNQSEKISRWIITVLGLVTVFAVLYGIGRNTRHSFFGFFNRGGDQIQNTVSVDHFTDIVLDMDCGGIEFVDGDTWSVSYDFPEKLVPSIEVSGDTLKIKQRVKNANVSAGDYTLTITLPKDVPYGDLDADLDMGSLEIRGYTFDKIKVDADLGNVELLDVTFRKGEVNADLGNVEVSGTFDELNADCDLGNLSVTCEGEPKLDLSCDLGNLSVNGKSAGNSYHQ